MQVKKILSLALLCAAMTGANFVLTRLGVFFGFGLYLDTLFTMSAVFSGGLAAGIVTAVLTQAAAGFGVYAHVEYYLFAICGMASALLARVFTRFFPAEYRGLFLFAPSGGPAGLADSDKEADEILSTPFSRMTMLIVLSLSMCLVISVLGGIIAWFIQWLLSSPIVDSPPETWFKLGLLKQGMTLLGAEILARIPVNMLDRFISCFGAFAVSYLLSKGVRKIHKGGEKNLNR